MIKFENTEVMNFEGAIRGMRNPLNSWDKSDSYYGYDNIDCRECISYPDNCRFYTSCVKIGSNDLALMKKLIKAGSDHRKFMRQIIVSVDIIAPLYWWKEFDTYKVATVSNSCSTMHKIHDKEFTFEDFSYDRLSADGLAMLEAIIKFLEVTRKRYLLETDTGVKKLYWYELIQLLPSSYNQRRTITLNYETLYNIYGSRRNHKLDEWRDGFMEWIESLPYAKELITDRS